MKSFVAFNVMFSHEWGVILAARAQAEGYKNTSAMIRAKLQMLAGSMSVKDAIDRSGRSRADYVHYQLRRIFPELPEVQVQPQNKNRVYRLRSDVDDLLRKRAEQLNVSPSIVLHRALWDYIRRINGL